MKFRGRALQKMREPDELDRPIALVDTRGWTALFVVMSMALGAAIWAFTGSLPLTARSSGILTSAEGNRAIATPVSGTVERTSVQPGQKVKAGDLLLAVTGAGATHNVTTPVDGIVINVVSAVGQSVSTGDTVATVEATGANSALVAQVFVPTSVATSLRPGIHVMLAVEGIPAARFGLLKGTVSSVGQFPIDPSMAVGVVGSAYLARELTRGKPAVTVTVELKTDQATKSGLAWTSADGPPFPVIAQRRVDVTFSLGARTPFDAVLGTS
jgi:multidrug resistance efflux pump